MVITKRTRAYAKFLFLITFSIPKVPIPAIIDIAGTYSIICLTPPYIVVPDQVTRAIGTASQSKKSNDVFFFSLNMLISEKIIPRADKNKMGKGVVVIIHHNA